MAWGEVKLATIIKTTAVFLRPFQLSSFEEVLPAGEYDLETELMDPVDWIEPGTWTASVLVHLHPRASHPGLARTLTVPLAELEKVMAKDKLTGKALVDYFLEEMLADPMIRLVMKADGVSEGEIRNLYPGQTELAKNGGKAASVAEDSQKTGRDRLNENQEISASRRSGEHARSARPATCDLPEWIGMPASRRVMTTDDPVDLDGRRSHESKKAIDTRRHAMNELMSEEAFRALDIAALEVQLRVAPARDWAEAMEKAQFLLRRYSSTPEAQDARVRKLIRRALGDMARLAKREERSS